MIFAIQVGLKVVSAVIAVAVLAVVALPLSIGSRIFQGRW